MQCPTLNNGDVNILKGFGLGYEHLEEFDVMENQVNENDDNVVNDVTSMSSNGLGYAHLDEMENQENENDDNVANNANVVNDVTSMSCNGLGYVHLDEMENENQENENDDAMSMSSNGLGYVHLDELQLEEFNVFNELQLEEFNGPMEMKSHENENDNNVASTVSSVQEDHQKEIMRSSKFAFLKAGTEDAWFNTDEKKYYNKDANDSDSMIGETWFDMDEKKYYNKNTNDSMIEYSTVSPTPIDVPTTYFNCHKLG